jgi:hypothetical protein
MATSNADFYRAQFANMNNQDRQRKNALQDDFAKSQYDVLGNQITAVQNDPSLADNPTEKANRINTIRQQQLKIMTPGMGKSKLAQMMQRYGISDTSGPQSVPAEAPLQLPQAGPQQLQVPFSQDEIAQGGGAVSAPSPDAMKVQPEAPAPTPFPDMDVSLPGKQAQHMQQPASAINQTLAGTATPNPYSMKHSQLMGAGFSKEDADKAIRVMTGLEAAAKTFAPHSGQWETVYGTKDGEPFRYFHSKATNQIVSADGTPLDEGDLDGFVPAQKSGALKETIVPDPESPTGYSKIAYDPSSGLEKSRQKNVVPPRGFVPTQSVTVDNFGNKMVTTRTPQLPGAGGVPPQASSQAPPQAQQGTPAAPQQPPVTPTPKTRPVAPKSVAPPAQAPQQPQGPTLDPQGHIPVNSGHNPQVVEAANRLFDGAKVEDLPLRVRIPASMLAREYGWGGQGMFLPKDKLMIRESQGILKQFASSPALRVLDDATSRQKIAQVLHDPEKRGVIGGIVQNLTASSLTEPERQFVTLYNQAIGRISGLAQLVRSGRMTEATINRLKSELPNPLTTSSSQHAIEKFQQIQNEIDIAMQSGQFSDSPPNGGGQTGHKEGDSVKLKNGQTVTIKKIYPDGHFDY